MHIHRISTLLQYCNNTVGYSYIAIYIILYITLDTECARAIASSLIHAVVLCDSAQRYTALMVILQSHRTHYMILTEMLFQCICYTSETYHINSTFQNVLELTTSTLALSFSMTSVVLWWMPLNMTATISLISSHKFFFRSGYWKRGNLRHGKHLS